MGEKRAFPKFYITLFIVVLCMPWFVWVLLGSYVDAENYENRQMAPRPAFDTASYGSYAASYEAYFNDSLPFRDALIAFNSKWNYFVFHSSVNDNVILGKDGWLFYANKEDGDPIACYQGQNLYTEEQLAQIAANLCNIKAFLDARGIEFVVLIAPNKERMYPEMMPDIYGQPASEYAALQVVRYIKEHTDIRIIYPYKELMMAKRQLEGRLLYHKVDTHWNYLAGYIASRTLLQEFGIDLPEITSSTIQISEIDNAWSDLAAMIHLSKQLEKNEPDYLVSGYEEHQVVNDKWDFPTELIYHAVDADPRDIYIVRDSFCSAMSGYIGSQFNSSYMIHSSLYGIENFIEHDPDIFVLETVERAVSVLGVFDIQRNDS